MLSAFLTMSLLLADSGMSATTRSPQRVTALTSDGKIVCDAGAAFSQIPGHVDLFIGHGYGIGSQDYCHHLRGNPAGFLALFRMDWSKHELVMQHYLLQPLLETPSGLQVHTASDPFVAEYKGEYWVAFECTAPAAVSACIAPLTPDFSGFDLSRFTVPITGLRGPYDIQGTVVALLSARTPTLLSDKGELYLYWQVDPFDDTKPRNLLVTRGMELEQDSHGRLWGKGSGGRPLYTDDPKLTTPVHDVRRGDRTADHVALTSDIVELSDDRFLEISSIGGTAGKQVCRSTRDDSPGCWRVALSVSDAPLGGNVFGEHPLSSSMLPSNVIESPRMITDPAGHHYLMGDFKLPKNQDNGAGVSPPIASGVEYIPFEPAELAR